VVLRIKIDYLCQHMEENNNLYSFNIIELLRLFWKWRVKIIVVCVIAGIISAVVSFMITPKYKSSMVFFPTVNNSISAAFLRENSGEKSDPLEFGSESQVEEMLQILNSDLMKREVINRFNLIKHYNIDTSDVYKYVKLSKMYDRNISFHRTEFTSIEATVLDENPQMAADLVDGISVLIDSIKTAIQRQVALQALSVVEQSYNEKRNEIKILNDSLEILGTMGIYNIEQQASALTDRMARGGGNVDEIKRQQMMLAKYGRAYETLARTVYLELEKESDLKKKYVEAKVDAEGTLTHKFVVSKSGRSDIKAYPIKTLIVLITLFSTFAFSLVIIFIYEKIYLPVNKAAKQAIA
jgi:capsular polysaccharide biosynthesis protein